MEKNNSDSAVKQENGATQTENKGELIADLLVLIGAKNSNKINSILHRAEIKEQRRRLVKKVLVVVIPIVLIIAFVIIKTNSMNRTVMKYKDNEKWTEAIQTLESMWWYPRSKEEIKKTYYEKGEKFRDKFMWDDAIAAFEAAGDYNDASEQILATRYSEGLDYQKNGKWDKAIEAFILAEDYSDAKTQIQTTYYKKGVAEQQSGNWKEAVQAFELARDYSDASVQINETLYLKAQSLYKSGNYSEAYNIYKQIKGYKDVDLIIHSDSNLLTIRETMFSDLFSSARVKGQEVSWGHYEQDGDFTNGSELIKWIVLDVKSDKALLISKYALDVVTTGNGKDSQKWESSYKREWLNTVFYDAAFDSEEKEVIVLSDVANGTTQGSERSYDGGNNTQDHLFHLSYKEVNQYMPTMNSRRCFGTNYATRDNDGENRNRENYSVAWWLRSPGYTEGCTMYINGDDWYFKEKDGGDFYGTGYGTDSKYCYMRPAMWISLK